ncbi:MAG: glutathione S-transferase family protein [Erythrobacter sp.]
MAESTPDLVIYGSAVSPFVRKAASCCIIKDVAYEIEAVNVFNPPQWFRDISPMKRIPVLRDRAIASEGTGGTIADSSAICAYIEKKHPEPAVYPAGAFDHARALFWEEYADTSLAFAGGMGIFRPIFFAVTKGEEPDLAKARATWAEQMPPLFDTLETALDGADFLVGGALSIADITTAAVLGQIALVAEMPLDKWPALAAHYAAMAAHPAIAAPYAEADAVIRKALPERFDLT